MQGSDSAYHVIVPSTDHTVRFKMVTNAPKAEHGEYITPQISKTRGSRKWGGTHSTARKGYAQDRKPTERIAINRVTRKAETQRVWSY